jgi:drug/metabolite transporter (DMT)-like permease
VKGSSKQKFKNSLYALLPLWIAIFHWGEDVVIFNRKLLPSWVPYACGVIGVVMLLIVWLSPNKGK